MFSQNPWKYCNDFRDECWRCGVVRIVGRDRAEVMWGITRDGSQIRVIRIPDASMYRVVAFPAGANRRPHEWAVYSDGPASLDGTEGTMDPQTVKTLKNAKPIPQPKTLYSVNDGGQLAAILMTRQMSISPRLMWVVFRVPTATGGRPRFTKTTTAGTFLDAGRWWGWSPNELTEPRLRRAGDSVKLVEVGGIPAIIWIGIGGLGSQREITLHSPNHQEPPSNKQLQTAQPLARWFAQG